MRLKALASAALAAGLVAVPQAATQESSAETPLVRMRDGHNSDLLFRLDPRTLQEVGRPIRTFRGGSDLRISPDGTRLAFADPAHPLGRRRARSARIQFVDLVKWRSMGVARVGRHGWLTLGWVSRDRVVAVAGEGFGRQRLVWVDARTRKVVARRAYAGWTVNTLPVPGGLALVLGPEEGVGPVRILVLDPEGGVRTIDVDGIKAGADYAERTGQVLTPAITVDPVAGRMYVVAARGLRVAEVDLASGAVAYHPLAASAAKVNTGATAAKGNIGVWWRDAAWVGDGRIAVTGDHWPRPRGRTFRGPVPFGVRMIDTRTWSIATLDPRSDTMHVAQGTVLAAGTRFFEPRRPPESTGLLGFDETGRRAFTRFRGRQVTLLGSRGGVGYVWLRRTRTAHVIDLESGRTIRTIRTGKRAPFLLSP